MRVLLIENSNILDKYCCYEIKTKYVLDSVESIEEGVYMVNIYNYSIILLDALLTDGYGCECCKLIRRKNNMIPILMLLEKEDIDQVVESLACGADAILTKPITYRELSAYIDSLIKRNSRVDTNLFVYGDFCINFYTREVKREGKDIGLSRKEFDIVECLVLHKNSLITLSHLMEQVWEDEFSLNSNSLQVHIKNIRNKLDKPYKKKLIKTVHGFGYKMMLS